MFTTVPSSPADIMNLTGALFGMNAIVTHMAPDSIGFMQITHMTFGGLARHLKRCPQRSIKRAK
jgi:hypothetical protein